MNAEPADDATDQKHRQALLTALGVALLLVVGCAEMPTGPTVAVMPAPNKPFEVFMQEEQLCRGWAAHSIGQPGHDAAAQRMLSSTAAGLAIGTLVGAVAGGHRNVETGAAMGTVMGAATGTSQSNQTAWSAQRRYDIAYQQCMYSKGNLVPSYGYGANRYAAPPPPPPQ
jgi:hypothetical protein